MKRLAWKLGFALTKWGQRKPRWWGLGITRSRPHIYAAGDKLIDWAE